MGDRKLETREKQKERRKTATTTIATVTTTQNHNPQPPKSQPNHKPKPTSASPPSTGKRKTKRKINQTHESPPKHISNHHKSDQTIEAHIKPTQICLEPNPTTTSKPERGESDKIERKS